MLLVYYYMDSAQKQTILCHCSFRQVQILVFQSSLRPPSKRKEKLITKQAISVQLWAPSKY